MSDKHDDSDETKPKHYRGYYCYYDTPEGEDIDKKMFCCARYGVLAGSVIAAYDILMYSHATTFQAILQRYVRKVAPLAAMGITFAGVSNSLVNYRRKNDLLNYFLGGFACGPFVAYYVRSGHGLFVGGLFLGVVGMVKKIAIDSDTLLLSNFPNYMGNVYGHKTDWSIVEDPKCACDNSKPAKSNIKKY